MTLRLTSAVLVAGWLAQQLASPDRDIEQGIAAYEAGNYEEALVHLEAAQERRGEQPEIAFDRGLVLLAKGDAETARTAFERASEAEDPLIRASAFYELGNVAFDAEDWEGAIAHYIDALKARPDHANAKWNLELALERKRAEEEEKKKEEEQQEQEEEEKQNEEKQDEEKQDEEKQDEEKQDEEKQDEQKQDEGQQDEEKQDEPQPEGGEEPPPEPSEPQDSEQGQRPEPPPSAEGEPPPQPKPVDQVDLDKALEQLDHQDAFRLDRPAGGYARPKKDW